MFYKDALAKYVLNLINHHVSSASIKKTLFFTSVPTDMQSAHMQKMWKYKPYSYLTVSLQ